MSLPECPQKSPYAVEVEKGKRYSWCSCGLSEKQPFCDGSHKGTEFRSMPYLAEENKTVYFCGCKKTGNKPTCDGSHNEL